MDELFFDNRIAGLIIKFLQDEITETEYQELQVWVGSSERAREIFEELTSEEKLPIEVSHFTDSRKRVLEKIRAAEPETRVVAEMNKTGSGRKAWLAVAASIVVISTVAYLVIRPWSENSVKTVQTEPSRFKNNILPGSDKARLTLADGTVIELDSSGKGMLGKQGEVVLKNTDGALEYVSAGNSIENKALYNRIETRKQGQYRLTLADGTQVWLNAESSLYFPAQFSGNTRMVEITGEVYFDVAHNTQKPFIVRHKNMNIEVTGTEFNVSSYDNDESVNTTLVKGSVNVSNNNTVLKLKPGQQAQLTKSGSLRLDPTVNVEEVIAWKEGYFEFSNADIKSIMRQLERWYDIEVVYETDMNLEFNASNVSRDLPISELLKLFELTEQVHFRIEGKKVVVMK
jgi:transmembrane sensor